MASADDVVAWLVAGDPAVAWQAERDLLDAPPRRYRATRARVATTGWGARLLERRAADGRWGRGLYTPKWTSTFYTLRLLSQLGLDEHHPAAVESCGLLLDQGVRSDGGVQLWQTDAPDCCVTAMMLSLAVAFGHGRDQRVGAMLRFLRREQMADGGWNCRHRAGATAREPTHGSFHTTLSVLEGLADAARASPARAASLERAARRGRAFFLAHRLYRSHRTGAVVSSAFTRFSFPPQWKFDVLRALDHFRDVGAPVDRRLDDALALVERRRGRDGRWVLQNRHPGRAHFELERVGAPSRFNTLRALRVLRWARGR